MVKLTSLPASSSIPRSSTTRRSSILPIPASRTAAGRELLVPARRSVALVGQHYIERYFGRGSKSIRSSMEVGHEPGYSRQGYATSRM